MPASEKPHDPSPPPTSGAGGISKESHLRSVLKGFTWRIIASSTTFTISYILITMGAKDDTPHTDALQMAGTIAFFEFFIKIFIYYLHERIWQLAPRGTIRKIVPGTE